MQLLPSKEDIVQRTLSALQVLKTRGRAKRPGSQAAAATAVASSTVSGADTGAAIAGNGLESATAIVTTVLMPQVGSQQLLLDAIRRAEVKGCLILLQNECSMAITTSSIFTIDEHCALSEVRMIHRLSKLRSSQFLL